MNLGQHSSLFPLGKSLAVSFSISPDLCCIDMSPAGFFLSSGCSDNGWTRQTMHSCHLTPPSGPLTPTPRTSVASSQVLAMMVRGWTDTEVKPISVGGKHSHALQLGPIREKEDPANELPEGWKPMLRTCAKFKRYTDANNYYIPNNGELHGPAKKRRSGEAARCGDNRRRGSLELQGKRAPSAQPLTFTGSATNRDRPVLQH
ncbi:unnamed protein product [Pleuronectes platessa]|uniref:Uncharacterized protein n=1 Tax=Pleuronectes platessa TaxID=8262 RepID=A0A9N7Z6I3_PLEPL|nr:unnamed protein product [Pleuronectes platessa]